MIGGTWPRGLGMTGTDGRVLWNKLLMHHALTLFYPNIQDDGCAGLLVSRLSVMAGTVIFQS